MASQYRPLSYTQLESGTGYRRPPQRLPERVTSTSPATDVMTDLTKVAAITIGPCATLDAAHERMMASGVRLLLVTDERNTILGLITATDLQGERPMQYLQEVGGKREDIFVRDIMSPQEKLEALFMVDVVNACVGDIVETLKNMGRQHALVIDLDDDKRQVVRGIFSTKQISMQLGVDFQPTEIAKTFAELEAALG